MVRLAALLLLLALALARPALAATPAESGRIVDLVNQARAAHGLTAVAADPALTRAAESYAACQAAADFFGHTGPDGSTLVSRAEAAGYVGWLFLAENLAAGQTGPDAAFEAWMNSPGHRANILAPRAREIGIGHAYDPDARYRHYWTMELGARGGAPQAAPAPAPPPAGAWRVALPAAPLGR